MDPSSGLEPLPHRDGLISPRVLKNASPDTGTVPRTLSSFRPLRLDSSIFLPVIFLPFSPPTVATSCKVDYTQIMAGIWQYQAYFTGQRDHGRSKLSQTLIGVIQMINENSANRTSTPFLLDRLLSARLPGTRHRRAATGASAHELHRLSSEDDSSSPRRHSSRSTRRPA